MITTLELPAPLFRKLEQAAAAHGKSPEQFIIHALEQNLAASLLPAGQHRVSLPLIPSAQPGTLRLTNADIEELLA